MTTKKSTKQTRKGILDELEKVSPGITERRYYQIYTRDPKTHQWMEPQPWGYTSYLYLPKTAQKKAHSLPPYDSVSEDHREIMNRVYHVYSEDDRKNYNRSIVAFPMTLSKLYRYAEKAPTKATKRQAVFDHLMRNAIRRNRSKHPLQRRHL